MKVTAIVGSYRKGGISDQATDAILASAKEEGADVTKIYLIDKKIEFCRNCRTCTQQPGTHRGECCIADDMNSILDEIERSDAIILASPMNFWTVTAAMKTFIERLICFAYWPWKMNAPKVRSSTKSKRAIIVASSAAPAFVGRLKTRILSLLKTVAGLLGARTAGVLYVGLAGHEQHQKISERTRTKAHRLGKQLILGESAQAAQG